MKSLVMMSVAATFVLLPVQFLVLPFNVALVDVANVVALPLCWVYIRLSGRTIHLPYLAAMWLVLVAGLVGTVLSRDPSTCASVLIKEVYLYTWFVTFATLLNCLPERDMRRIALVWCGVSLANAGLLFAQFLSRSLSASMGASLGLDIYRPSGLFSNANATGFFQLMAFVPLVLLRPSRLVGTTAGLVLFLSLVATGSMGALAGFFVGFLVAMGAILIDRRAGSFFIKLWMTITVFIGLAVVGLAFFADLSDTQSRLDYLLYGRSEGSAESRFALWTRGFDFILADAPVFGIGPGTFRDIGQHGKEAHNDLLAFTIERGAAGLVGLLLLGWMVTRKSILALRLGMRHRARVGLSMVVFPALVAAAFVESQTHEIFHARELWLVLGLQEAMLFKMMTAETGEHAVAGHGVPVTP